MGNLLGFFVTGRAWRQPTGMIRAAEKANDGLEPFTTRQSRSVEIESESSLIRQTQDGSHAAFAELIRCNHAAVRAVLGRYLRDDNEVDELAQRAFVIAFRSIAEFRGDSSFGSWLAAIARRQAAMYMRDESRRRKHETTAGELALLAWTDESFQQDDDVQSKLATLDECLKRLPAGSHDVVTRFYSEGESIDVIAEGQGRSRGAIRMWLMRIRKTLAECISKRLSEAEGRP